MSKRILSQLLTLSFIAAAFPAAAQDDSKAASRPAIEQVIQRYILDHPEVVLESVRLYQQREQTAQRQRSKDAVAAHLADLFKDPASPVSGANSSAEPVTIVEFFDYRCGYCKKVQGTVEKIASEHNVRVIYKEFPILGAESVFAARAALASARQGLYGKFHDALMSAPGALTPDLVEKLAAELGIDVARLKKDMESPEIDAAIVHNNELAGALGVESTPMFVIGKDLVPGALSAEAFQSLINAAREAARNETKAAAVHAAEGSL